MRYTPAKLYRSLKRKHAIVADYTKDSGKGAAIGTAVGIGATAVTFGAALPLVPVFTAAGAAGGAFVRGMYILNKGAGASYDHTWYDYKRDHFPSVLTGNTLNINGFTLMGDNRDINIINATQFFLTKRTQEMKHMDQLPDGFMKGDFDDAREALKRLQVFVGKERVDNSRFVFTRQYLVNPQESGTQEIHVLSAQSLLAAGSKLPETKQVGPRP